MERWRKGLWHERGDEAVDVSDSHAKPNQREHVQAAIGDGLHSLLVERPRRPDADRRGQRQLDPCLGFRRQESAHLSGQQIRHRQHEQRHRQRGRQSKPRRHVLQLGIGRVFGGDRLRLERHAADRARPRAELDDLGVHGARKFGSNGRGARAGRCGVRMREVRERYRRASAQCRVPSARLMDPAIRICDELLSTTPGAKVVRRPAVNVRVLRRR